MNQIENEAAEFDQLISALRAVASSSGNLQKELDRGEFQASRQMAEASLALQQAIRAIQHARDSYLKEC